MMSMDTLHQLCVTTNFFFFFVYFSIGEGTVDVKLPLKRHYVLQVEALSCGQIGKRYVVLEIGSDGSPSLLNYAEYVANSTRSEHPSLVRAVGMLGNTWLEVNISYMVDGITFPFAGLEVQIYEDDIFFDDLLVTITLDTKGYWFGQIHLPFELSQQVVYGNVQLSGKYVTLLNGPDFSHNSQWGFTTNNVDVDQFEITQLSYTVTDQNFIQAYHAFVTFNATSYMAAAVVYDFPPIGVLFPGTSSAFNTYYKKISIEAEYFNSSMVFAHELGHWVMYNLLYPNVIKIGGLHGICNGQPISEQFAFNEGYAHAFALIVTGSTDGIYYWFPNRNYSVDLENYYCTRTSSYHLETDEGRIAAVLWDLYDDANDDNGGDPGGGAYFHKDSNKGKTLSAYQVLVQPIKWGINTTTITNYWNALLSLNVPSNSQVPFLGDIFLYNYATAGIK